MSCSRTTTQFEPAAPRSRDKHSTTEPLRSLSKSRCIVHFYCLVTEAGFYSDVVVFACGSSDLNIVIRKMELLPLSDISKN